MSMHPAPQLKPAFSFRTARGRWMIPALLLMAVALQAAILTCARCGYEYQPGQADCSHCGNHLPVTAPESPEKEAVRKERPDHKKSLSGVPLLKRSFLESEMAQVQRLIEKEEYWGAYLLARNTRSLNAVSESPTQERDRALGTIIRKALRTLEPRTGRCMVCQGQEARTHIAVNLRGELTEVMRPGTQCGMCQGQGFLEGLLTEDKNQAGYSKALRNFRDMQTAKGFVRHRSIWFPPDVAPRDYSVEETAKYRSAFGGTCEECHGMGFFGCEECTGLGRIPCTNEGCVHGAQLCERCEGKRTVMEERGNKKVMCRHCAGRGTHTCTECRGDSYLVCEKCHGGRRFQCKDCRGDGEAEFCTRCDGLGTRECGKCDGTGEYKSAPCPSCDEEGLVLCKSCEGYGHKD